MKIDIHTHAFADNLAERAVKLLAERSNISPYLPGTLDKLSESTKNAGLNYSIVAPIATKPSQVRTINLWAKEINNRYNNLISFGTLHPDMENIDDEINWLVDNGFKGIKIHPDYQETIIDAPKYMPMHKGLAKAGLILLTHAGFDIGLPPPRHCMPKNLASVMEQVPELIIIAAHMGGVEEQEEVEKYYLGKNIYLDTCYTHKYIDKSNMVRKIRIHGAERILFGTDSPWTDQKEQIEHIMSLDLTNREKELILGENAKLLLKL